MLMEKRIADILVSRRYREIIDTKLTPSAVLLLLLKKGNEYHILFTRRSHKVAHHKGEISFPGGTVDPEDSGPLQTALREGAEEIGLDPSDVIILGRLDDIVTVTTGFIITPYVGTMPYPYRFQINANEITELIFLPLGALAKAHCTEISELTPEGKNVTTYYFYYQNHIVWGATARILRQFMDLVY